ncbi:glycosyltransferase family 2 protein [Streptomyces sp. NP160]|uniref:glycosyltransferase family 2 protein n=1 Tax=Streptomyces sp. NP160 TaxID=2586637 RepID=UPI0015D5BFC1|nr:glycosyltransferase family 2 protein [Streptomyces sp. NP160]
MTASENTPATTVVVHCGELDGGRLERRLREVVSTTSQHARVIATVVAPRRLSPSTAQRCELAVVRDGGAALLAAEVAGPSCVLVLPFGARTRPGWDVEVLEQLAGRGDQIGVLRVGSHHLFAYPESVTSLDAPRLALRPVDALLAGTGRTSPAGGPTLGAVLIVKDEQARLGDCLTALVDAVDEVVVYDTGSTDDTVAIARSAGATVVEGYWDDDFSAARNRALASATTDWILSVDADEVLVADQGALRRWLRAADGELALVRIVSPSTAASVDGDEVRAYRLFLRTSARWEGALHEQVVPREGATKWTPCSTAPEMHLLHSGYSLGHENVQGKAQRNLLVAETAVRAIAEDDPRWPEATVAYARALGQAGRHDECIEVLRTVVDREVTPGNVVQAARGVVPLLLQRGLLHEAAQWTDRAAQVGETRGLSALRHALVRYGCGETLAAVADLQRLVDGGRSAGDVDLWGRAFDLDMAVIAVADLQVGIGQAHVAATSLVQLMVAAPHKVPVSSLLQAVLAAGGDLRELAAHVPDALLERSLREAPVAVPDLALAWSAALADARPGDPRPLVAGSVLAARTSVEVALEWSVRVREAGLTEICPLRTIGADEALHPRARLFALGLLHHGLGDTGLDDQLDQLESTADPADREQVRAQLRRFVPDAVLTAVGPA